MGKPLSAKTKRILSALLACSGASVIALSSVASLAAYLDVATFRNPVTYETENVGATYFSGGDGTLSNPYLIGTASQLRNLQKLNSLGLFDPSTEFELSADILWSGEALRPIGSDDIPFEGTFDGRGHTITGLLVDGFQTWDVGMFGYVGITGTIKNLILDGPTVCVGANADGGNADSTNPLHSILKRTAQNLPIPSLTQSGEGYVSWTDRDGGSTISGLASSLVDANGDSHAIAYESSDESLLSYENGAWVTHATASEHPDADLFPAMLTGRVFAEIDDKVSAYTVERYEVNVLGNGTISDGLTSITDEGTGVSVDEENGIFKTIWPLDPNGGTSDYHGIYVGFFCGDLDGSAKCCGLVGGNDYGSSANAKIVVSGRPAASSSSLVGHCRDDDVRDGAGGRRYGHAFDFGKNVTSYSFEAPAKPYEGTYYYRDKSSSLDSYASGNIARQIANSNALSKEYLKLPSGATDSEAYKYMRVYPTASENENVSYAYASGDGSIHETTGRTAMRFNEPLSGATDTLCRDWRYDMGAIADRNGDGLVDEGDIKQSDDYDHAVDLSDDDPDLRGELDASLYDLDLNVPVGYCLNNGFLVSTNGGGEDIINAIAGKTAFSLTFTIDYVATTANPIHNQNSWQIMYNASNQNIHRFQPVYNDRSGDPQGFFYKDATLQNLLWYDLHHPYQYSDADRCYREIGSQYTPVPIVDDGTRQTATLSIEINRDDAAFWAAYYGDYPSSSAWNPCFAIGPGKDDSATHWKAASLTGASQITDGSNGNWNNFYDVWRGPFVSENPQYRNPQVSQRGLQGDEAQFFNSFFALQGDLSLDVLSFGFLFAGANGNVSSTMKDVDYLYRASDVEFDGPTDSFASWNRASDTRVSFDVTTALASGNATYYYYREATEDGYGASVHADYTNFAYEPMNTEGYAKAMLLRR
jgi:hypothetical protein